MSLQQINFDWLIYKFEFIFLCYMYAATVCGALSAMGNANDGTRNQKSAVKIPLRITYSK